MRKTLLFLILICVLSHNSFASEIAVSAKRFVMSPDTYLNRNVVMKMKYSGKASIQDREGFLKCTCEGVTDSGASYEKKIMFFNVYLDSDTLDKFADRLEDDQVMTIHAFVDKINRNWTRLTVYEIEIDDE